jgi:hypothetical protein
LEIHGFLVLCGKCFAGFADVAVSGAARHVYNKECMHVSYHMENVYVYWCCTLQEQNVIAFADRTCELALAGTLRVLMYTYYMLSCGFKDT